MSNSEGSIGSHLRGLRFRIALLRAALLKRTNEAIEDTRLLLEQVGLTYSGVEGNVDPFELFAKLPCSIGLETLDFSRCRAHVFCRPEDRIPGDWSSEEDAAAFIGRLVYAKRAATVVEIGCFVGRTSSYLATALRESGAGGTLYCIDANTVFLNIARRNMEVLGLADAVRWILGQSTDPVVLAQVPNEIDLLYIDSYHDYSNTINELISYQPKLSRDGWIVFHDSIRWPGVRKAVNEIAKEQRVFIMGTSKGNGLAVLTGMRSPNSLAEVVRS